MQRKGKGRVVVPALEAGAPRGAPAQAPAQVQVVPLLTGRRPVASSIGRGLRLVWRFAAAAAVIATLLGLTVPGVLEKLGLGNDKPVPMESASTQEEHPAATVWPSGTRRPAAWFTSQEATRRLRNEHFRVPEDVDD